MFTNIKDISEKFEALEENEDKIEIRGIIEFIEDVEEHEVDLMCKFLCHGKEGFKCDKQCILTNCESIIGAYEKHENTCSM